MISAVILAAGASSRMGRPKLDLRWKDTTVLGAVVRAVRAARPGEIIVVASRPRRIAGARVIVNPRPRRGLSSSIRLGVEAAGGDAVLLIHGDLPAIRAATIRRVMRAHNGRVTAARYHGQQGHPVIFGRRHFDALRRLRGDRGAKRLLKRARWVDVDDPGILRDVDRPVDLNRPGGGARYRRSAT